MFLLSTIESLYVILYQIFLFLIMAILREIEAQSDSSLVPISQSEKKTRPYFLTEVGHY